MFWAWILFTGIVLGLLTLDFTIFHRRSHRLSLGEAIGWTIFWVTLGLIFAVILYPAYEHGWLGLGTLPGAAQSGREALMQFLGGYLIEKSLSFDNLLAIGLILSYFQVPSHLVHRLLFWGIAGALVLRGAMISIGVVLFQHVEWLPYVLGVLLFGAAINLLVASQASVNLRRSLVIRLIRRLLPVTSHYVGGAFITRVHGRWAVTPLLLALVAVETTDLLYAVDSIPAVFAITRDPFIILTSNIFALMGLRSLYSGLSVLLAGLRHLKTSLVIMLAFLGVKMALIPHYEIPVGVSLIVIGGLLVIGIAASWIHAPEDAARVFSPLATELPAMAWVTYRQAKRIVILLAGSTVVLFGLILLVMPGPGLLVIFLGFVILATEFVWARRWLKRYSAGMKDVARRAWKFWPWGRKADHPDGETEPEESKDSDKPDSP